MLELEPGPLRDTTYVRQLLFYKLWNEKILVCDDEFAIQLRKRVLSTLTPLNPYAMFHAKLRSCLPYVHKDVHNVTEFLLKANISFKHSCIQFLNSRRSQFENIHLNVDTINVDSIAINDSPLDFLYGEVNFVFLSVIPFNRDLNNLLIKTGFS